MDILHKARREKPFPGIELVTDSISIDDNRYVTSASFQVIIPIEPFDCTELYSFKYSELIQIICTLLAKSAGGGL